MTSPPLNPDALAHLVALAPHLAGLLAAIAPQLAAAAPVPVVSPTMDDKSDEWLALRERLCAREDIAPASFHNNRTHLRTHLLPAFGDKPLNSLNVTVLRPWVRTLADRLAPTTVRNIVSTLKVFLDDAIAEGWTTLTSNPARDRAFFRCVPDGETIAGRPVRIPLASAQALLASPLVPLVRRVRYLLAFTTGARDGELAGLTWARVHLAAAVPHVEIAEAMRVYGTDGKRGLGRLKTKASKRVLPLHPLAVRVLTWWRSEGWLLVTKRQPTDTDPVLPAMTGAAVASRPDSAQGLRDDLVALGLPTKDGAVLLTFRYTRSSFASWLADEGVPLEVRQALMGHSGTSVTERSYTGRALATLAATVALLPFDHVCLEAGPNMRGKPRGRPGVPKPRRGRTAAGNTTSQGGHG